MVEGGGGVVELPEPVVAFLDVDASSLTDGALGQRILALEVLVRRAQAAQAAAVRAFDTRDAADADGAASTASWLREHLCASQREARQAVGVARALDRLPLAAAALAAGSVSLAHVRTLAGQTRRLDAATVAAGEPFLVGWARRLDPHRFAAVVRRWVATVAPAEFERDTERRYDARWLSVAETFGGMFSVQGMLDPEGGAILDAAIEAMVRGFPAGDERSSEQQRADALVDLAELARAHELLPAGGGHRPEILVHVPGAARAGSAADAGHAGHAGVATLATGAPLPPAAVDRLSCDARFRRLVLDAAAVPVELGRATRVVPPALRKLVALRDGGCRYPGCPRPAAYCEAHHVVFWRNGGRTDADNLVLLCRYHHHLVHDRGHALTLAADGTVRATRPDGRVLTGRPRGPTAAPV